MQNLEMIRRYLVTTILLSVILGSSAFSYKDAKNWGKKYPKCLGKNQSPVIMKKVSQDGWPQIKKEMKFTDTHKKPAKMTMKNTGHTVEIKAEWSGKPPTLTGGPLNGTYVFEKITFHWSKKKNEKGSEHMSYDAYFNKPRRMDMEMHVFYYREDLKSFEKAESEKDGLAVFAVMLTTESRYGDYMLTEVEKNLNKVKSINSTTVIPAFDLLLYLDVPLSFFIYYKGSLDYPPCSESVNWFLRAEDLPITKNMLNNLKKVKLAGGDVSNIRPTQALNNRKVYLTGGVFNDEKL